MDDREIGLIYETAMMLPDAMTSEKAPGPDSFDYLAKQYQKDVHKLISALNLEKMKTSALQNELREESHYTQDELRRREALGEMVSIRDSQIHNLKKALEFYADEKNWQPDYSLGDTPAYENRDPSSKAEWDRGEKASNALEDFSSGECGRCGTKLFDDNSTDCGCN